MYLPARTHLCTRTQSDSLHGCVQDYLAEVATPFSNIYTASSLDRTMTVAYNQTRDFMMRTFDLTEDQAITAITVAVDFEITQVLRNTTSSTLPAKRQCLNNLCSFWFRPVKSSQRAIDECIARRGSMPNHAGHLHI